MTGLEYLWRVHLYSTTRIAHAWIAHPHDKTAATRTICGIHGYTSGNHLSVPDDGIKRCRRCLGAIKRIEASS